MEIRDEGLRNYSTSCFAIGSPQYCIVLYFMNYMSVSLRSQSLPCITFTWRIWNQPRHATFFKLRKTLLEEYQASFSGRELTVTSNILEEDKNQVINQENLLHRNTLDQSNPETILTNQTEPTFSFPTRTNQSKIQCQLPVQITSHYAMTIIQTRRSLFSP